jgi:RNA ligase (TIGR02306 family)
MRKLASIQRIEQLDPITGADAIVKAKVLGWSVVVKKSEVTVGKKVVYCEIDSLLPERPEFEFLRASSFKPAIDNGVEFQRLAGFRIKTVKLRGQISQGICFPLSILPPGTPDEIGTDVTEILGITKFEVPLPAGMGGMVKGGFPGFLTKTDETRVQLLEATLEKNRGKPFIVTEKLDGTSFSAYFRLGEFGVCSRNLELQTSDPTSIHVRMATVFNLREKLQSFAAKHSFDIAVQGELIGPGIQGNKYALKGTELRVFSLVNLQSGKWLDHEAHQGALRELDLTGVPVLETLTLNHTVPELVQHAIGMSLLNPKTHREGIVLRPPVEEHDDIIGGRLSFKAINPQFLLKYDE